MKSLSRFKTARICALSVFTLISAALALGVRTVSAQSLFIDFRFDGQSGAAATTATLAPGSAGQTFTIDVWATVVGDATHTNTATYGFANIHLRGFSEVVSGGGAFTTGAGIGTKTGTFVAGPGFLTTDRTGPNTIADNGKTTDGGATALTGAANLDGIIDFGSTGGSLNDLIISHNGYLLSTAASAGTANQTGRGGFSFEIAQFQFTTGTAAAAAAITSFFPTQSLAAVNQRANYTQDGSIAIQTGYTIDANSGINFAVTGGGGTGTTVTVTGGSTVNLLSGQALSSTVGASIQNTGATALAAGTYTFAASDAGGTGIAYGASNPTAAATAIPAGATQPYTFSATTSASTKGSFTVTYTATGSGGSITNSPATGTSTLNVGNATADNSNQLPSAANPFSNATKLTAAIGAGGTLVGLQSQITSLSGAGGFDAGNGALGSANAALGRTATIVAGNVGASAKTVAMQWRTLSTNAGFNEQTGVGPGPKGRIYATNLFAPTTGLVSNVVDITGLETGAPRADSTDPFVLQMSYNPARLPKAGAVEAGLAANKLIYLVSFSNPPGLDGLWDRAVDGNTSNAITDMTDPHYGFLGSWTTFATTAGGGNFGTATPTNAQLLTQMGAWGVDTANHVVWAILDHNSQFAVVPEPSTLMLAGLGLLGLVGLRRKMKKLA